MMNDLEITLISEIDEDDLLIDHPQILSDELTDNLVNEHSPHNDENE